MDANAKDLYIVIRDNWKELKKEYVKGTVDKLADFAKLRGVNYHTLYKHADGWREEREKYQSEKRLQILNKVEERGIEHEVNRQLKIMQAWDEILDKVFAIIQLYDTVSKKDVYSLEKLTAIMERVQKGQMLSLDARQDEGGPPVIIINGLEP